MTASDARAPRPDIRMYFHFRSPYSRIGLHRITWAGLEPDLIVFTGPPPGNIFRDPADNPAIQRYVTRDIIRLAVKLDLPTKRPRPFDVNFALASRAFVAAKQAGKGFDYALAVSDARWADGKDISDLVLLRELAASVGLDGTLVDAAQDSVAVRDAMAEYRALGEQDGAFGVPFFVVRKDGKKAQAYWGQDRVDMLLEDHGAT
ncbi:MAG: DsbA family protein [Alphaproteobacteria bacterium]|nr:DsbA family protein [Alphaproteobacteria bacterium]